MKNVSIIIPTLNEEKNILPLVKEIDRALTSQNIAYEIIFVDDHSVDKTYQIIQALAHIYPASFYLKKGKKGKAFSIIEGCFYAKYKLIAMIDADLQYPPAA